jgi:hypothetical protein
LGGLDGIDELALAHGAGALETECSGKFLELRQDHGVQAGTFPLAGAATAFYGGARHFGDSCQRISLSVRVLEATLPIGRGAIHLNSKL